MKKWLASMLILGFCLLAMSTPGSFALAADEEVEQEIIAIRRQIHELRKQIIDKSVAAGKLTPEAGEKYKQELDERFEWHLKHGVEKKYKPRKGKLKNLKPRNMQEVPAD